MSHLQNISKLKGKTILVTGSAGFIGFHVAERLLSMGVTVIGFDNFNEYYDKSLKESRNEILEKFDTFTLYRADIRNISDIRKVFQENPIDKVCHLAAQAGVRYSMENPQIYMESNIVGFTNLIEEARKFNIKDFIYTSSSSVYGGNTKVPFSEGDFVDRPVSLYAVTKKANELLAHSYRHLFGMRCTGLRLFTVYGPWMRPDMALFSFTQNILAGKPVAVYNFGDMKRDFTYIDDIVDGIVQSLIESHQWEIINIGSGQPFSVDEMITYLEKYLGKKAAREYVALPPGDMLETYADITQAKEKLGYQPKVSLEEGIKNFVTWYKEYYHIGK